MKQPSKPLSYRDAGVDIDRADRLIGRIRTIAARTNRPGVLGGIGGFAAMFELPAGYEQPVLVSGTDGVGTKLRLAIDTGRHHTVGEDLVAMCVNDVVVTGAEPLFFLDYYATGQLDTDIAEAVVAGIGRGCEKAGVALIGGETAELPGMYEGKDYDLAGFCVGIAEKSRIIDGSRVSPTDVLIGIASSGPHSNGYSLIRKVIEVSRADLDESFGNRSLGETLMEPTLIYVKAIRDLIARLPVSAIAHITGGGITENLPRVLPVGTTAEVDVSRWKRPPVFDWLQNNGNIEATEMLRTFNCGIGMVLCVPEDAADAVCAALREWRLEATPIGALNQSDTERPAEVSYHGLASF